MNLKKNKIQSMLLLWVILGISCLIIFFSFLFGDRLPVFNDCGSDTRQQYLMQYATIINHIQDGNWSFWDFNNGFGTSMLALNLTNPFLMVLYLLGVVVGTGHLPTLLLFLLIGEIFLAGTFALLFLNCFKLSESSKVIGAYLYALSGYMLVWGQHYQFGAFVVYLPLLLMLLEHEIQRKRFHPGVSLLVAVMVISSVYMSYMSLILAGCYLIFRLAWENGMTFKKGMSRFVSHCGSLLLGIGMGMVLFLPNAMYLLTISSRLDSEGTIVDRLITYLSPYSLKFYITAIYRICSSSFQGITDYNGYSNFYEAPVLFASALFVLLLLQYLFTIPKQKAQKKQKILQYLAVVLSLCCLFTRIGACVFNAFAYPFSRHSFLFVILIALMSAFMLDQIRLKDRFSMLALLLGTAFIFVVHMNAIRTLTDSMIRKGALLMLLAALGMALLLFLMHFLDKKLPYRLGTTCLLLLLMVSVCTEGYLCYNDRDTLSTTDSEFFGGLYNQSITDALAWLSETDSSFYRVEKDFANGSYCMDALVQDYHGISTYNSTPNRNLEEFYAAALTNFPLMADHEYSYRQIGYQTGYADLFGIKYLLSHEADLTLDGFSFLKQFGDIYIYQNEQVSSFGRFYTLAGNSAILSNSAASDNTESLDFEQMLSEVALVDSADFALAESSTGQSILTTDKLKDAYTEEVLPVKTENLKLQDKAEAVIPLDTKLLGAYDRVYLEFDIKTDSTCDFTVNINEPLPYRFRVQSGKKTHVRIAVPSSYTSLTLSCYNKTFSGTIKNITFYGSKTALAAGSDATITMANPTNDSLLTGTVETEKSGLLFLPMAYENGWSAFVDGEQTELLRTDLGFVSIQIPAGTHSFELRYQLPYLSFGAAISILCAMIWILRTCLLYRRSYLKKKR